MTDCIVIGSEARANATAQLLTAGNVPSMAIAHDSDHAKVIEDCKEEKESGLKVVAVFCNDSDSPNSAIKLFHELRWSFGQRVRIHALKDGNDQTEPSSLTLYESVDEVFCSSSNRNMSPTDAALSIKTRWFSGEWAQKPRLNTRSISIKKPASVILTPSFETLSTLTKKSAKLFFGYLDMNEKEIAEMTANRSIKNRKKVSENLRFLARCLDDIGNKIAPKNV